MVKKILSIDGGGVRGVIPAYICMRIEEDTGKRIHEIFDFITGTSTGAILGATLASGISAKEAFNLYVDRAHSVFKSRHYWFFPWRYITMPKYDRELLLDITKDIYGKHTKLRHTKTHFMCTSYNSMEQTNEFFKSWDESNSELLLSDAVGRSWASPFYFGKWIDDTEGKEVVYSDGGVGIYNNTVLKSLMVTSEFGWNDKDKFMLNLGCGSYSQTFSFSEVVNWMNLKEAWHIVFNSKDARDNQMETLKQGFLRSDIVPNLEFRAYEPSLTKDMYKLDGIKYVSDYIALAEELYNNMDISELIS